MSLIKSKGIVITSHDYSESSVILKCFTEAHGMQSYLVNGVRKGKGAVRPSHLLPLTLLEIECYHHETKGLQRLRELKCQPALNHLHFDIVKSSISMFVAELLYKTLREENHPDPPLFAFLYNAIQILDIQQESVANFPAYFMIQLTRYLGFFPKGAFSQISDAFDLREGSFCQYDSSSASHIPPSSSSQLSDLLETGFDRLGGLTFSRADRERLLEHLNAYYREHVNSFAGLKSHKVLAEVLA